MGWFRRSSLRLMRPSPTVPCLARDKALPLTCSLSRCVAHLVGATERQVLLEAAAVLSEDPSSQLSSWSADNPDDPCRWEGVTCGDDGRVFEL